MLRNVARLFLDGVHSYDVAPVGHGRGTVRDCRRESCLRGASFETAQCGLHDWGVQKCLARGSGLALFCHAKVVQLLAGWGLTLGFGLYVAVPKCEGLLVQVGSVAVQIEVGVRG